MFAQLGVRFLSACAHEKVGRLRLLEHGLRPDSVHGGPEQVDPPRQVYHVRRVLLVRDGRGQGPQGVDESAVEGLQEPLADKPAVAFLEALLHVEALAQTEPRDPPVAVLFLQPHDPLAELLGGGHVDRDLPSQNGDLRDIAGDLADRPEVLDEGEAQQSAEGHTEDDPGREPQVPRQRAPLHRPLGRREKTAVPRKDPREEVVQEQPPRRTGQDFLVVGHAQLAGERRPGASLLAAAAEVQPAQDRGFLVGIMAEEGLHEHVEPRLHALELLGVQKECRVGLPGLQLIEKKQAHVSQTLAHRFHGAVHEGGHIGG